MIAQCPIDLKFIFLFVSWNLTFSRWFLFGHSFFRALFLDNFGHIAQMKHPNYNGDTDNRVPHYQLLRWKVEHCVDKIFKSQTLLGKKSHSDKLVAHFWHKHQNYNHNDEYVEFVDKVNDDGCVTMSQYYHYYYQ